MASSFTVICSNCSASLQLKDASLVGKHVRCPECRESFVVELPEEELIDEVQDDGGFYEELEEEEYDEFFDDEDLGTDYLDIQPRKKRPKQRKTPSQKKKRRSQKQTSSETPVGVIVASVVALVMLLSIMGAGIYFGLSLLAGGSSADRLKWLPNDLESYTEIHAAQIWKADVLKPVRQSRSGNDLRKRLEALVGMDIDKIDLIVIGTPTSGKEPTVVIQTAKPIDASALRKNGTSMNYAGKTLYPLKNQDLTGYLAGENVLVVGTQQVVESAIDRNGACSAAERFQFLPRTGDLIFGSLTGESVLSDGLDLMMIDKVSIDSNSVQSSWGTVNFSDDLDVEISVNFLDRAQAQEVTEKSAANLAKARQEIKKRKEDLQQMEFVLTVQSRAMVLKLEDMFNSAYVRNRDSRVDVGITISSSVAELLAGDLEYMAPSYLRRLGQVFVEEPEPDEVDDEDFNDFDDSDDLDDFDEKAPVLQFQ